MVSATPRTVIASCLIVALAVVTAPSFAAPTPAPATLTGTVYADDVTTPLAGATVVVTDANGVKLTSQPTGPTGAFTIASVAPGRSALALETKEGSFAVATPVTLAPGETRGVHLALKGKAASNDTKNNKKPGGVYWTGAAIGAMSAVLVGFVAAAVVASDNSNNNTPTSPSNPTDK